MKNAIKLILKAVIFISCLIYIFLGVNYDDFLFRISSVNILLIIPSLIIVISGYIFLALRLVVLVKVYTINSFISSFKASVIALGVNNIFPLKLGEVAKVMCLNNMFKISLAKSFSLIVWERFIDINILTILGFIVIGGYHPEINMYPLFIFVIVAWSILFVFFRVNYFYISIASLLPIYLKNNLNKLREALFSKRSYFDYILIVIISLVIWFIYAFQIWFILDELLLIKLSVLQLLTVFVITSLGMAVPSVPGAIGVYEASMVLALSWFNIDKIDALMAGIVCHVFIFVPCTLMSLVVLSKMSLSFKKFKIKLLEIKYKIIENEK